MGSKTTLYHVLLGFSIMGGYKFMQELARKKQSDTVRFIQRTRTWQLSHLKGIHRATRPTRPEKARRLGYRAKQGYAIFRVRMRRGGRRRRVAKGCTYGKPVTHGVNHLKPKRNHQAAAELKCGKVLVDWVFSTPIGLLRMPLTNTTSA